MTTKVTTDVIEAGAVTSTELATGAVGATQLASTLDLSSKAVTLAAGEISAGELASTLDLSSKTLTMPAGQVVQVVNTQSGAVATGTTQIPTDDTIPQNTEGDQYMTLAITPKATTNKLKIEVVLMFALSGAGTATAALFQDSTANALAACCGRCDTGGGINILKYTHYMAAGTTSATTFKVRAGPGSALTLTFNGSGGTRVFGGVAASSITISEISV